MPAVSTVTVVYPRIDSASATVDEEIGIAEAETEAFRAFRSRLRRLEPVTSTSGSGGGCIATTAAVSGVDPEDVKAAYWDTVLSMDHYERDYGEPLMVNVGAEFGGQVREMLAAGVPIPPMALGVVEAAAERAGEERRQFLRALENERDSLRTVERRLGEVERELHECHQAPEASVESVGFGSGRRDRLRVLASECEALAADRQRSIHHGPITRLSGVEERSIVEFLYGDADHRFPALVEVADVAERIESALDW